MKNNIFAFALTIAALSLYGCSSGEKTEEDLEELYPEELPVEEAETDAVPEEDGSEFAENGDEAATDESADFEGETLAEESSPVPPADSGETTLAEAGVEAAAPTGGMGETYTYQVKSGDTLMKIAFEVYGDLFAWRKIYEMNQDRIGDFNQLSAGMTLQLERPMNAPFIEKNGNPYLIQNGDTLGTISTEVYGTPSKWRSIYENNKTLIKDPNKIYAGFTLYYVPASDDPYQPQPLGDAGGAAGAAEARTPANSP